jgi:hypothetical protein
MKSLLFVALTFFAQPARAGGKVYVFLGGRIGNLQDCAGQLSVHSRGDSGGSDVAAAVARTKAGETITVAAHSDGSIFASSFIQAVKKKDPAAKINYVDFEGFRPNGGGRKGIGRSNVAGLPGVQITCVTMPGAPNYPFLKGGPGCKTIELPAPNKCGAWCRHYAVMKCGLLNP